MIAFPESLPITAAVPEITKAIEAHQVIIVAGETGSGKTTQLPKICLAMGRGAQAQIGCTQPRRIAATSVAERVATELESEVGDIVGYKVRFNDRVKRTSAIKFMTDGILLAEIQSDPLLRAYDTLIIDEAHERSLNIDFLLGFLKQLLPRRKDLRVIVSSATLETQRFSAFFGGAPVIEVSGRTYPVDVLYRPPKEDEADLADAVANTVNEITELDPRNDILVFLPGEREIRDAVGELEQRALPHTTLLPLYARLSSAEQQRVFQSMPDRRVVLATNVAETSLTIPGIVYVVDSGVARVNRYNTRTGVTQLLIEDVSQASADQRKGRCGRTANGICFRLYEEQDYATRPKHTDPEIKRVGLAGVILRMKALGLGDIENFPFLDPPQKRAIDEGYRVLEELGALDGERLTKIGEQLGRLPLDPRLGRMIIGGREERALREVVVIAAALGLQDPRERPLAAQQAADESHRKFKDEGSDFVGYLKLWEMWKGVRELSRNKRYKWCRENFLSYNRMREWDDIHAQIVQVMREWDFAPNDQPASGEQLHRALLPGLLSKIGMWNQETRSYMGARQTKFLLHPSSGLAKKPPQWVMAAELVETSQLFARTVAKIDPLWLEQAGGDLCKRSYGDPHWEQRAAQVVAKEQVTLYGLPIVKNRSVSYATIDPKLSRELFITHALVRHEYTSKGPFMEHNRRLLDEVQRLRDKARRSDMVADEYALYDFFDERIPADVVSGKTFEEWRREAERRSPRILMLDRENILLEEAKDLSPSRYPDALGPQLPLTYVFDPGADDDGITVTVSLAMLPQLDPDELTWTIPGWHEVKLRALLDSLGKATRKQLGSLDDLAHQLATQLNPFDGPMLPAVEKKIFELTGVRITRDAWSLREVPAYLSFGYRIVDEHDKLLAEGRDLVDLQGRLGRRAADLWSRAPRAKYERTGLTTWDFESLPASVNVDVGGRRVLAYPALVASEHAVDVKLLESPAAAAAASREGLRRLYMLSAGLKLSVLEAQQPLSLGASRKQIVLHAIDDAFDTSTMPASRTDFANRLAQGRARLPDTLGNLVRVAVDLYAELDRARALIKPLLQRPGPTRVALDDIQAQLQQLVPPDLMRSTPLPRLVHITRYIKAVITRLHRLSHDLPKDQQKAAQVLPFVQRFAKLPPSPERDELRWLLEEFRVQIFAPELKTAVSVSPQRLEDAYARVPR